MAGTWPLASTAVAPMITTTRGQGVADVGSGRLGGQQRRPRQPNSVALSAWRLENSALDEVRSRS